LTPAKRPNDLRALLLYAAIEDNLDTIAGRAPKRLRASQQRRRWSRRAAIAVLSVGLIVASAGVARWSASAQIASAAALPRGSFTAESVSPASLDRSLLSQPTSPDVLALGVRRVVIDPGHGGDNLGTSGPNGLLEKHLTVDIAERIRRLVTQQNFEAVMTRTTDETLSLWQRAGIANGQRGDIFVSIHLNSLQPSSACGVETYYLGPTDDPQRAALAAKENEQPGYSLSDMQSMLRRIYADARRDESKRLAEAVQGALMRTLRTTDPTLTDRGVKMAPFVVLVATHMPAILAEVSCLSNNAEAERLRTPQHRDALAAAVVSGIEAFARETRSNRSERTVNRGI
jgi:N-acetylmuramoyl-L-alanine amidase